MTCSIGQVSMVCVLLFVCACLCVKLIAELIAILNRVNVRAGCGQAGQSLARIAST